MHFIHFHCQPSSHTDTSPPVSLRHLLEFAKNCWLKWRKYDWFLRNLHSFQPKNTTYCHIVCHSFLHIFPTWASVWLWCTILPKSLIAPFSRAALFSLYQKRWLCFFFSFFIFHCGFQERWNMYSYLFIFIGRFLWNSMDSLNCCYINYYFALCSRLFVFLRSACNEYLLIFFLFFSTLL